MKPRVNFIILLLFFLYSCVSATFVLTGNKYSPLSENDEVKVVSWGDKGKYEVIGLVDIGESTLESRVEKAKEIARENGADAIMPKGKDELNDDSSGFLLQSFVILRTKEEDIVNNQEFAEEEDSDEEEAEVEEEELPKEEEKSPQYSNLPRATFKLLLNDLETLGGENFRGSLYPNRFVKVPLELKSYIEKDNKLLILKTQSGKRTLFLVVPKEEQKKLKEMISKKRKLNFAYTPIAVYKSKYPVLKYLDEILE